MTPTTDELVAAVLFEIADVLARHEGVMPLGPEWLETALRERAVALDKREDRLRMLDRR